MSCPIGIFDSGYGGLTILKEIVKRLPQYDYIYFGDNARTPYGTRSFDVVYRYTREAVTKLYEMGCRLVILACNTASAKALRTIQQVDLPRIDPKFRVLGVIRPSVESIMEYSKNGHIGILATTGTVVSESYLLEIAKLHTDRELVVSQEACPMWVPIVENNEMDSPGARYFVKKHIDQLLNADSQIDTVILACTHYPLLYTQIADYLPAGVNIVEQGHLVAESLEDYLYRHPEIRSRISNNGRVAYYTTEREEQFDRMVKQFVGEEIKSYHIEI